MGRITDYGSFHWCDTCDHMYLPSMWDTDAQMCIDCAAVGADQEEEDG